MTRCARAVMRGILITALLSALAAVGGKTALAATADPEPLIRIDHVPLAVDNVDRAAESYRRLGFAIKPGRLHADGIRTQLVKFPDGAGIELISAPAATDPDTAAYVRLIAQGEGPAFVCFIARDMGALERRLHELGEAYSPEEELVTLTDPALAWLFFGAGSNRSPTDRPEHFAHANTANATLAIWIAGGDQKRMLAFFKDLGARDRS
jgi:catechol 2,3-dioxygenase-like lactoylglutathione lyase family enzyme